MVVGHIIFHLLYTTGMLIGLLVVLIIFGEHSFIYHKNCIDRIDFSFCFCFLLLCFFPQDNHIPSRQKYVEYIE